MKYFSVILLTCLLCFSALADETEWAEIIETDAIEGFYKFKLDKELGAVGCPKGRWFRIKRRLVVYDTKRVVTEDDATYLLLSAMTAFHGEHQVKVLGDCTTPSILDAKQIKTRNHIPAQ